ncbi:MAG: hypothetical protein LBI33_10480 [Propionibacteriaceae bacterium]|nr:hypothetical protein [Propionibacteriaceae bacterium]
MILTRMGDIRTTTNKYRTVAAMVRTVLLSVLNKAPETPTLKNDQATGIAATIARAVAATPRTARSSLRSQVVLTSADLTVAVSTAFMADRINTTAAETHKPRTADLSIADAATIVIPVEMPRATPRRRS